MSSIQNDPPLKKGLARSGLPNEDLSDQSYHAVESKIRTGIGLTLPLLTIRRLFSEKLSSHSEVASILTQENSRLPRAERFQLRKGHSEKIFAIIQQENQKLIELKFGPPPEILSIAAPHGNAEEGRWVVKQLAETFNKYPNRRFRLWLEAIVPMGMPTDLDSVIDLTHAGLLEPKAANIDWISEMDRFPLSPEIMNVLRPHYDLCVRNHRSTDHGKILINPANDLEMRSADQDKHNFPEYDIAVGKSLTNLMERGLQLSFSVETSPLEACVDVIHENALRSSACGHLANARSGAAITCSMVATFTRNRSSTLRDTELTKSVAAAISTNKEEIQVIPRGYLHRDNIAERLSSRFRFLQQTLLAADFTEDELLQRPREDELYLSALPTELKILFTRNLLDFWIRNAWALTKGVSRDGSSPLTGFAALIPDFIHLDWLQEVDRHPRGTQSKLLESTLSWISTKTTEAPAAADRAKVLLSDLD